MNARAETSIPSPARLRAQQRSVEVNGREVLPWSMAFSFGLSAEALAARAELHRVIEERRGLAGGGPAAAARSKELLEEVKRLRKRLDELTAW